ncbi:phage terminase small subunit P27 family [Escherichia coli]|nr:phage terminase small subunit P27 family [Escherichia coli]
MSGPPKTPPHLHVIRGNPSKRPVKSAPELPRNDEKRVPPTPKHFDKRGKYWFKRMAEELNAEGIISKLDSRALELLVEAYTEYRHHCETLDAEGYTYRTETQSGDVLIKAHPAAAMKADAWKRLRAMLGEFGMSPASRAKVNVNAPDDVDPMAEFMRARD